MPTLVSVEFQYLTMTSHENTTAQLHFLELSIPSRITYFTTHNRTTMRAIVIASLVAAACGQALASEGRCPICGEGRGQRAE